MATYPIILATGSSSGAGTPGVDKVDLIEGEILNLVDTEPTNNSSSYEWFLDDTPYGVSVTLVNPGTATPSFVVPASAEEDGGTVLLRCLVDGVFSRTMRLTLPLPNTDAVIPHFEEETESNVGGNIKGWHKSQTEWMRASNKRLPYILTTDPSVGGVAAPVGSIARRDNAGTGELWQKVGAADTAWSIVGGAAAHAIGGAQHLSDTLANLNSKISDATLIDTADSRLSDDRDPNAHDIAGAEHGASTLAQVNAKVSDATLIDTGDARLSDDRDPNAHDIAGAEHNQSTLAQLNAKISDATLDDFAGARTPSAHGLGGSEHNSATLAQLNAKVSDATLIDTADSRLSDDRNDANAIHDNVSGEIAALTEKVTPVDGDHVLIEDSEAGNVKKRVAMSNMLGGGGSSGPVAAAQGDYIRAGLSTDQLNPVTNDAVDWDTIYSSRGDVSLNVSNGQVTIPAGRSFLLAAQIHQSFTSGFGSEFFWYDVTNAAKVDGSEMRNRSSSAIGHQSNGNITKAFVAPLVDTIYECRTTVNEAGVDIDATYTSLEVIEIGAVQADVVGGLEFMDIIEVTADQTSVSFGAAGDGAFQRALDGDIDHEYEISYYLPDPVGSPLITLRPNSIDPAVDTTFDGAAFFGGFNVVNLQYSEWRINAQGSGYVEAGTISMKAETGFLRSFSASSSLHNGISAGRYADLYSGRWDNTTTNITSLQIFSSIASAIKAGARFVLWRKTRNNLRADSAAVYERMAVETITPGALVTTERTTGSSSYGGSIVGVSARIEKAITGGSLTVNVNVEGVGTVLSAVLDTTTTPSVVARLPIGVAKFAANKNISVEFVPAGTSFGPPSEPVTVTAQVHLTNDALITQNDRVVTKTVLGANATTLSVAGLQGDLDGVYEVTGRLLLDTANGNLQLRPNGAVANLKSSVHNETTPTEHAADWRLATWSGITGYKAFFFKMTLYASRTMNGVSIRRRYHFDGQRDGGNFSNRQQGGGVYDDATSDLTSLDFVASVASGILAGSEVTVRRIKA